MILTQDIHLVTISGLISPSIKPPLTTSCLPPRPEPLFIPVTLFATSFASNKLTNRLFRLSSPISSSTLAQISQVLFLLSSVLGGGRKELAGLLRMEP